MWISNIILWKLISILRISNCFLWKSKKCVWNANLLKILWISKNNLWNSNFILRISNSILWNAKFNVYQIQRIIFKIKKKSKLKLYITNVKFFHLNFSNSNITLCYFTERVWLLKNIVWNSKNKVWNSKNNFWIQKNIFECQRIMLEIHCS